MPRPVTYPKFPRHTSSDGRRRVDGRKRTLTVVLATISLLAVGASSPASATQQRQTPMATELATFAAPGCEGGCGSGSTVGPDGALYVTDGKAGRVLRIDPGTGATTTFASGLPASVAGIGGAMDVAFIGHTAYVLVTLVGPFFGQADVVDGIYRVNGDGKVTAFADIGAWSKQNPPHTDFFIDSGVQYALQPFRGGLLVTDGHHNRVLHVTLGGRVTEMIAFRDIVPTGLAVSGDTVYMGEAGPVPHSPDTGKVVTFTPRSVQAAELAAGASLIVDVEFGPHGRLYALSQGRWDWPNDPANAGLPASADTGALVIAEGGHLRPVVLGLDRPTSLEFIGDTAFVVTLTGKVIRIDHVSR
jgi:hypothetical protein